MSDSEECSTSIKNYYKEAFYNCTMLYGGLFDNKDQSKEWFSKDEYIFELKNLLMILSSLSYRINNIIREFENER